VACWCWASRRGRGPVDRTGDAAASVHHVHRATEHGLAVGTRLEEDRSHDCVVDAIPVEITDHDRLFQPLIGVGEPGGGRLVDQALVGAELEREHLLAAAAGGASQGNDEPDRGARSSQRHVAS
jgi:hypothetical protein